MRATLTKLEKQISAVISNGGQFLLPPHPEKFSDIVDELTACESLIKRGTAIWLREVGRPGIERKP